MVNLKHPELSRGELTPTSFPDPPSEEELWSLRGKACSSSQSSFILQTHQRFLRRVLSPDAPTRSVLVVHGTGTGKTCTAIQVAEEYILRPEYQDKKVLVVSSAAVEETFRDQIFDMSRVKLDDAGILQSKQCTGRRYLEMLQRIEAEPKNWENVEVRDKLERIADRLISEFYEFVPYASFGNRIRAMAGNDKAIHEAFDNRLLIIDEAHNIRPKADMRDAKAITEGLERILRVATGAVVVFLTATPMYDSYDEILLYFNLFRYNDDPAKTATTPSALDPLKIEDFFTDKAVLKPTKRQEFELLCERYVSYVKGENPFTFPFRLPPPRSGLPPPANPFKGTLATTQYLPLVESLAKGNQAAVLLKGKSSEDEDKRIRMMQPTVAVLPGNVDFDQAFTRQGSQYAYRGDPFLGPGKLDEVSAKFVRVIQAIDRGEGIAFVYSNFVAMGARLFAMALEEHGYGPFKGSPLLANKAYKGPTKGSYILLTSEDTDKSIASLVSQARHPSNRNGEKIRIIISSPLVAEGVDFRCVRQAHILDPWWNMSRIEQVIGRSLRTCSHTLLTNEKQNCTVYLHVVQTPERECYDAYTYRAIVEPKAEKIAKVRAVLERAAMDCPFRVDLPDSWVNDTGGKNGAGPFTVKQQMSEGRDVRDYPFRDLLPPAFTEDGFAGCKRTYPDSYPDDPQHVRPLSAYLDVRDELLDKLGRLLLDKPIWDKTKLLDALLPVPRDVALYTVQQAIDSGTPFRDAFNRQSLLESKGSLYALRPNKTADGREIGAQPTVLNRIMKETIKRGLTDLGGPEPTAPEPVIEIAPDILDAKRKDVVFPANAVERFDKTVLDRYVFDHRLTEPEKIAYLRANPDFAPELRVKGTGTGPGQEILVRGFNKFDPDQIPIGDDAELLSEWTRDLTDRFSRVIQDNTIFTSLNAGGEFTMSRLVVAGDKVIRAYEKDSKSFKTTTCGTGCCKKDVLPVFAKTVDQRGVGVPAGLPNVPSLCLYCELLAREGKPGVNVWFTPEELSVLYDDPDLRKRFTAEFKKTNPK